MKRRRRLGRREVAASISTLFLLLLAAALAAPAAQAAMETAQQIVVHARAAARLTADSHAAQLQAARRCPSDACTVLFIHVPKTAGTTLFLSLLDYANRTNLGFVRCMRTVSPKSCVLWSGDRSMGLRHAHVITGHMPLAMDQRVAGLIERPYAVLAVLRDPISRMVSFFNFKQPNAGGAHGFLQWYLSQAQRHSCNLMTAYMAGLEAGPEDVYGGRCAAVSENALFKAQQNLATSITFLGTQARYDELVLQLACFLGTDDLAKQLLFGTHITPHERTVPGFRPVTAADFDPLLLDQIRRDNALDIRLVAYAEALLDARANQTLALMRSTCPKLADKYAALVQDRLQRMQESPAAAAPLQLVAPVPVANVGPQSRLSPAVQQQQEQPQTQLHYSPPQQLKPSVPVQDGNFAVPAPNRARVSIGGLVVELNAKQLEDRSRELQALAAMLQRLHHRTPGVAEIGPG